MVVGRSGVPNGDAAGAYGPTLVTTEGAGIIVGLGGAIGMPGASGVETGPCGDAWKKLLAISAMIAGSGQDGAEGGMGGSLSQMIGGATAADDRRSGEHHA
jgi:hypothetical protein